MSPDEADDFREIAAFALEAGAAFDLIGEVVAFGGLCLLDIRAAGQEQEDRFPIAGGGGVGECGFATDAARVDRGAALEEQLQDFEVARFFCSGEEDRVAQGTAGVGIGSGIEEEGCGCGAGADGDFEGAVAVGGVGVGAGIEESAEDGELLGGLLQAVEGQDQDAGGVAASAESGGGSGLGDGGNVVGKDGVLQIGEGDGLKGDRTGGFGGAREAVSDGEELASDENGKGGGDEGAGDEFSGDGVHAEEPEGEGGEGEAGEEEQADGSQVEGDGEPEEDVEEGHHPGGRKSGGEPIRFVRRRLSTASSD